MNSTAVVATFSGSLAALCATRLYSRWRRRLASLAVDDPEGLVLGQRFGAANVHLGQAVADVRQQARAVHDEQRRQPRRSHRARGLASRPRKVDPALRDKTPGADHDPRYAGCFIDVREMRSGRSSDLRTRVLAITRSSSEGRAAIM
jgi:hypothetical protein